MLLAGERKMSKPNRKCAFFAMASIIICVAFANGLQVIPSTEEDSSQNVAANELPPIFVGPVPPADFETIQEAINNASSGRLIEVMFKGSPYLENVVVNKSLEIRRWPYGSAVEVIGSFKVKADNVVLSDFTVRNSASNGIYVLNCSNCVLEKNNVTYNQNGIRLENACNCTLSHNTLTSNGRNFGVIGGSLSHFLHNIDTTNKINGKSIYYLLNESDRSISPTTFLDIGYLGVINSKNITIQDLTFQYNIQGLLIAYTSNSTIRSVTAKNNTDGVYLRSSNNNTLENNVVYPADRHGLWVSSSSNNMFCENYIAGSGVASGFSTIKLDYASNNLFFSNTVVGRGAAIAIWKTSVDNIFFHNNIYNTSRVQNVSQAYPYNSIAIWGSNSLEGNYWSDYHGVDKDMNGIGDTPYPIYDYWAHRWNNDTCPLMEPWNTLRQHLDENWHGTGRFNTTLTTFSNSTITPLILDKSEKAMLINITSSTGGFCQATILRNRLDGPFQLFVDNEERFDYTWSQNQTHTIINFTFVQGIHHIKIKGTRLCLIFGDLDEDGKVDGKDLAIVMKNFDMPK